jgi:TPR repeat protein
MLDGRGVSKDLRRAAHYDRLAAEHGVADAQYRYGIWLLGSQNGHREIAGAARYLELLAENGSPDGQFTNACMAENAIGAFPSVDLLTAVRYYEQCCDSYPSGAACLGWCLQNGRGIPVDFTVAAECFKKAADSGDADGINCFGCCL